MRMPESEDALAEILRSGKPVHATGSGTKLHHGPSPAADSEPVSLLRFDKITAYEPGDLVACVQAGVRLADLQKELARHGQWLPLDPPYPDATIGGILATNSSGPRRFAYGTARDHLIGLRVMGADGEITRSGGRVVKNVTGYDLHKLHIGAFGSLGVITAANFRLRARPELSAALVFPCASIREAHELLLQVYDSKLRPVSLEALDGRFKHIVEGNAIAIVGLEGTRPVLERHYRELQALGRPMGILEGERADPVWKALQKLPEALKDMVRVRIAAKPHDLPKVLPEAPMTIHAGSGIARVDLEPAPDLVRKVRQWWDQASTVGGYAVVESAPPDLAERDRLQWKLITNPLMRAIKASRDPKGVLNPGRMVV
jgi:glycolate oxidase FAD binding subunit